VSGEGASGADASGGGVTGDEAAWRDLVARYDMPADGATTAVPWPDRENLTPRPPGQGHDGPEHDGPEHGGPEHSGPEHSGPEHSGPEHSGPERGGHEPEGAEGAEGRDGHASPGHGSEARPDRTRVIRPATPPPRGSAPAPDPSAEAEDDDEHYVPPAPPPLPHLDPIAKGAWTALFGGPAYLVLTSLIGWTVPGWAALLAVMAFVGGFAVVVLRLGDGPSRGEGPDNGAVL
jgi:hypothetical protein